jgi:von Willebrand factor A domain-containing protein 8
MASLRRLKRIHETLAPSPEVISTLTLGDISFPDPAAANPSRLPHFAPLDPNDPRTREHLYFLLQKFALGQDVFLIAQPGPYARRLALTFCRCPRTPVSIHVVLTTLQHGKRRIRICCAASDVSETELKQGREIREGGNLVYVDSATVRAVKAGRILIIEGIEKAERGIMPVCFDPALSFVRN